MQRGSITRRGAGWYLTYRAPELNPEGKVVMRQRCVRLATAADEARTIPPEVEQLAADILKPVNAMNGNYQAEPLALLVDFVERTYLPWVAANKRAVTHANYMATWKIIKPYVPGKMLREIRTVDMQKTLDECDKAKPRAASAVAAIKFLLSGAFEYAIRTGVIDGNPMKHVKRPKGLPKQDRQPYRPAEIMKMLSVLPEPHRTLVLTAALTGLRKAELMGLQWADFQPDGTLLVQRAVWNGTVNDTKTRASHARIPVIPLLAEVLEAHKASMQASDGDWVFESMDGEPLRLDSVAAVIKPLLAKAGVKWHGWHGFRYGLATMLHELGIDVKTASQILRHANVQITMEFYQKPDMTKARAAMDRLGAAFTAEGRTA